MSFSFYLRIIYKVSIKFIIEKLLYFYSYSKINSSIDKKLNKIIT